MPIVTDVDEAESLLDCTGKHERDYWDRQLFLTANPPSIQCLHPHQDFGTQFFDIYPLDTACALKLADRRLERLKHELFELEMKIGGAHAKIKDMHKYAMPR